MKYAHILMAVAAEPWAIQPEKMMAILEFLALQAEGVKFSGDELHARISPQQEAAVARREGAIAVLPMRGVISHRMNLMSEISGGTSSEQLGRAFRAVRDDADVKAIVFDVDSVGGAVTGTDELSAEIYEARGSKPIIAQVDATAASAAYWLASAADEVVVTPSGAVGSIGVFTVHRDVSAMLEKMGVKETLIKAGKYKAEGIPSQPLSEEAAAHTQARVDASYGMFVDTVARNRGVSSDVVRAGYGQGRMVDARQAVADGMADRVATMNETLRRLGVAAPAPARRARAPERERRALQI